MTKSQKLFLFLARVSLGWLMFYAGITKLLNPNWSAAVYLTNAKILTGFYAWLASPAILPIINFVNAWGLTLLGISLVLGVGVRLSSILGSIMMLLYYLPLGIIHPDAHSFIVDDHIIYGLLLLFFAASRAGRVWGMDGWSANSAFCAKYPRSRDFFG